MNEVNNNVDMYPRNVDSFIEKMNYVLEREKNNSRVEYLREWLKWFYSLDLTSIRPLHKGYFFKPCYSLPNDFALQIWKKNGDKNYDEVFYNLISNHYSIYNNENTIVINKKEDE